MKKLLSGCIIATLCVSLMVPLNLTAVTAFSISQYESKEIIVKYRSNSEVITNAVKQDVLNKLKLQKLEKRKTIKDSERNIEVLRLDSNDNLDSAINILKKNPNVEYAVKNHKVTIVKGKVKKPTDPSFGFQWGLNNTGQAIEGQKGKSGIDINILKAWQISKGTPNVVVGIVDTGIDISHKDLKNSIFINKAEIPGNGIDDDHNGFIDDVNGWDFINDDKTVYDATWSDGHGTHIAGIISAQENKVGICGVAPNVKVLPLKFMDESYGGFVSDAIEAIEYGKKMGVKVFNCSWEISEYDEALEDVIRNTDAVFVCSAGNFSRDLYVLPSYPAAFNLPNVISVAAIDNTGTFASFSNFGAKVDIAAPGVSILSTKPENSYAYHEGTSCATPFVTGVIALIKSKNPKMSTKAVLDKVKKGVTQSKNLKGIVNTGGYLNAYKSLAN